MHAPVIGIVPAAGRATRLPGCMCSKELLPIGEIDDPRGRRPKAISEHLIESMIGAGADRICITIAPDKHDIVRFYGSGARHGVAIAYACQDAPTGMAEAIDVAYPWIRDATVLMGMPDTIFRPQDALARLRTFHAREHADLALAIAPTDDPARLGPVLFDAGGRVLEVLDKPERPPHDKVWVVACWSPAFTDFFHAHLAEHRAAAGEIVVGAIFQAAVEQGLRVRALPFDGGVYIDAGTMDGWRAAERAVAADARRDRLSAAGRNP